MQLNEFDVDEIVLLLTELLAKDESKISSFILDLFLMVLLLFSLSSLIILLDDELEEIV